MDPYAKAVSINGEKSMVIDMESTNPKGWSNDKKPILNDVTDSIIYEAHIRDLTKDEASGVIKALRGKYIGAVLENSKIKGTSITTGVDHLKELGITHIHLLPVFDYGSIDERYDSTDNYNWGYDPQNYNVPEGSYSLDPFNGEVRIKEFKEMVMQNKIEAIMAIGKDARTAKMYEKVLDMKQVTPSDLSDFENNIDEFPSALNQWIDEELFENFVYMSTRSYMASH